jgi:hypothetical protein
MSMPAALGWVSSKTVRLRGAMALLHYSDREDRAASGTSSKITLSNGMPQGSPRSPTSPRTTLTRGCKHTIGYSVFGGAAIPLYRNSPVSSQRLPSGAVIALTRRSTGTRPGVLSRVLCKLVVSWLRSGSPWAGSGYLRR